MTPDDDDFPESSSPVPTLVSRRLVHDGPNYEGCIRKGTEDDFLPVVSAIHLCGDIQTMVSMCNEGSGTPDWASFSLSFDNGATWLAFEWELAWELARFLCSGCIHTSPIGMGAMQAMTEWGKPRGLTPPPPIHPAPESLQ